MVLESYNPSVWEVKARGSRTESNSLSLTGNPATARMQVFEKTLTHKTIDSS